jgi:methionine aminotransferase
MRIKSKLPHVGTTIFTVMSAMAKTYGAINLSQGYPNFDCDAALKNRVTHHMKAGRNQYPPMMGIEPLRKVLAEKVKKLYKLDINPDQEITITAGATQALFTAIGAIVHPGDEVIVIDPSYDSYKPSIELFQGIPVVYKLRPPAFKIDWKALRSLITHRTRLIMINTPHNPIGKILHKQDLIELESLVLNNGLFLISDEVYEHLVYDGASHESVLRYPNLYKQSFVVYSFGKTYHNTGWKVGYCIAPPGLTEEFRKVHQFNVFTVNTPVQYAFADYVQYASKYKELGAFYAQKRDRLINALNSTDLIPIPSEGTYFQLFDYHKVSDLPDTAFVEYLTKTVGVAAIPVSVFYSNPDPTDRLIRLCFAKTEDTLLQAAERLVKM